MDKKRDIKVILFFLALFAVIVVLLWSTVREKNAVEEKSKNNEEKSTKEIKWDDIKEVRVADYVVPLCILPMLR